MASASISPAISTSQTTPTVHKPGIARATPSARGAPVAISAIARRVG